MSLVVCFSMFAALPLTAQCIQGNCNNGRGTFKYASGSKYIGQFEKGKINGKGTLYFTNGDKYVGDWKNQYRDGHGTLTYSNGDVYKGEFQKSKISGYGKMTFASGDTYQGTWNDGIQHGKGTYEYTDGNKFIGMFNQGQLHGTGKMYYADGSSYQGIWKDNYKDGKGKFTTTAGKIMSGLWVNGEFIASEGGATSTKPTKQNTSSNNNNTVTSNGKEINRKNLRNCNDNFCKDGQGIFTYTDGSKFIGAFKDGYPHGNGTTYYANGDKYVGRWQHHAPHGEGTMHYTNGRKLSSNWSYGHADKRKYAEGDVALDKNVKVDKDSEVKIWALVVGVARYTAMPVLKYTDDDAYQIYAFLKSPEGGALPDNQIKVLIDEDATKDNIVKGMQQLYGRADENDVVVLYFSGHGLPGSFLPVDYDGFNNVLRHDDIQKLFGKSKAKHKICFADACHSGTMTAMKGAFDYKNSMKNYYNAFDNTKGGMALLLSSKGDEFSLEDGGLRQGIFSHYLIRGLKGQADLNKNNIVTINELYGYVYNKVTNYTSHIQTPILTGDYDKNMPVAVIR